MNEQSRHKSEQQRLAVLYQVSKALGSSLNLDEVLNQVMDAVISLTGAERGFLVLFEESAEHPSTSPMLFAPAVFPTGLPDEIQVRAARNFEHETLEKKDLEVSRTVIRAVLESGEGIVTTDAQSDPRFAGQDSIVFYSLRAILCAPLKSHGRIVGVIYADNRAISGVFTRADLDLLSAFAVQAAIVIENARLYTRTDLALSARVSELETLTQIDRDLNAHLDYTHVIEITRRWAIQGTAADQCWVALTGKQPPPIHPDNNPKRLSSPALSGNLPLAIYPVVEAALREGRVQSAPVLDGQPAYLAAPILHSGKPIGVLVVAKQNAAETKGLPFSQEALQFLSRLAGRAANAIVNTLLYQAVQDNSQSKSKFVSLVTHELRIPMTSIKGYTDLLRQGVVGSINEQQAHFLDIIRNNVDRMASLVTELSDISRIESGRVKLELVNHSLSEVLNEALENLHNRFNEKQQVVEISLPPDLPKVYADPSRVVQILTNLFSNAWKYTPVGGRIFVSAREQEKVIRIEVRDTGLGISLDDQQMLFTQFFRSEDPSVRDQPGWGLGLSITKSLVEMMGGSIGICSELGAGSTFWFTLPVENGQVKEGKEPTT
jgi:signal transduction histidine kinase